MSRSTSIATLLVAAFLVAAVPFTASAAPVLSIQPSVTSVQVNDVFLLDVFIADADDLFAFDVELTFDDAVVRALSLLPGTFLGSSPGLDVDDFSEFIDGPELSGAQSRLVFPGVSGSGVLFSVRFKALAPGTTLVDFDVTCDQNDPFCAELRNANDDPVAYGTESGVVNVARRAVPEPATALLVAAGLAGVARRLRKR